MAHDTSCLFVGVVAVQCGAVMSLTLMFCCCSSVFSQFGSSSCALPKVVEVWANKKKKVKTNTEAFHRRNLNTISSV